MRQPSQIEEQETGAESAIRELARDDVERRRFLKMAGSVGAAGALAALIAACGSSSSSTTTTKASSATAAKGAPPASQFGSGDLGIVNYALTLEYLEAGFYQEVVKSGLFKGSKYLPTLQKFGAEEAAHVSALEATAKKLGKPAAKPKTDFSSALKSAKTVIDTAARHASVLNQIRSPGGFQEGKYLGILPDGPFGAPATAAAVLAVVKPFIVS
jgi:hypothetical protein